VAYLRTLQPSREIARYTLKEIREVAANKNHIAYSVHEQLNGGTLVVWYTRQQYPFKIAEATSNPIRFELTRSNRAVLSTAGWLDSYTTMLNDPIHQKTEVLEWVRGVQSGRRLRG
jgi:hypothetical protein